jgi:hypothetical protein
MYNGNVIGGKACDNNSHKIMVYDMFGLELLAAALLYVPSNQMAESTPIPPLQPVPVAYRVQCRMAVTPKISVLPTNGRVKYNLTKTKSQLNRVDVDTISPYGPKHKTNVSGLMSGTLQIKHEIGFVQETYDRVNQACVYLKSVDVTLHIDPTIYIAREYPKGSCMYDAILTHEMKHVREDQLIINKYTNIIGHAMENIVNKVGAAHGPYAPRSVPSAQKDIQTSLHAVLNNYSDQMNAERRQRQQAIDSFEEYESIGNQCKSERRRYRY